MSWLLIIALFTVPQQRMINSRWWWLVLKSVLLRIYLADDCCGPLLQLELTHNHLRNHRRIQLTQIIIWTWFSVQYHLHNRSSSLTVGHKIFVSWCSPMLKLWLAPIYNKLSHPLQYNNGIRRLLNIQPVTNSYKNTNSLKCNF